MDSPMNSPDEQCNGFTTLDEFIDSLLPDDLTYNNETAHIVKDKPELAAVQEKRMPDSSEIIRNSELPSELNVVVNPTNENIKPKSDIPKSIHKPRPTHLHAPLTLQPTMLDVQSKTNFNATPSVLYSPPLSPECESPLKTPDAQPIIFPVAIGPQAGHESPMAAEHQMIHAGMTFIGEKSFEKSYVYDPKPLTRKTRRALVPEEQKTQKYWMKRMRNNVAARKSREDRRRKELEVLQTMNALQDENQKMKAFINDVVKANEQLVAEMMRMKHQMAFNTGINQQQRLPSISS